MAKPKVKKSKSGTQNDSVQQQKLRQIKKGGDPGVISEKTLRTMNKKK